MNVFLDSLSLSFLESRTTKVFELAVYSIEASCVCVSVCCVCYARLTVEHITVEAEEDEIQDD